MLVWIIHNTVLAAILAIGVALLCRWRRCSPALLHALWLLVLLRLAAPPGLIHWPWQMPDSWLHQSRESVANRGGETKPTFAEPEEVLFLAEVPASGSIADTDVAPPPPAVEPSSGWSWEEAETWAVRSAVLVWVLGGAVLALRYVVGHLRLRRLVRGGEAASPRLLRFVNDLAGMLRFRPPVVRVVPGLASPLVGGIWRPVLLWPKGLDTRLPEAGVRAVLVHELAHLKRRDHWVRFVEAVAGCVWWWNPLYRIVRGRIHQYAEQACDAWVLSVLPQARRAYAEALVEVCSRVSQAQPLPALGVEGDGHRDFERRLTMIMREKVACKLPRRSLALIAAAALLTIPGLALAQREAPPKTEIAEEIVLTEFDDFEIVLFNELHFEDVPADERDRKLAELEAKIQAILKEIRALKKGEPDSSGARRNVLRLREKLIENEKAAAEAARQQAEAARKLADAAKAAAADQAKGDAVRLRGYYRSADTEVITLSRTTYTLTPAKAEALAKFLKEHVKAAHFSVGTDGPKLIVTATPETQKVIGSLVSLVQEQNLGLKTKTSLEPARVDPAQGNTIRLVPTIERRLRIEPEIFQSIKVDPKPSKPGKD